jgi:amidohydrolase
METQRIEAIKEFRKELHQHPEVSQNEFKTQERISSFLEQYGIETKAVGGTGLICEFVGTSPGRSVLIRADIDALPIQETNQMPYKSVYPGVSHKCGHDGHTAILAGLALRLKAKDIKKGKAILLFQPAEENGYGARAVLNDPGFQYQPDFVFALHNLPGHEKHQIVCKEQSFTAAATSIIIFLHGKTSHAAEPEHGVNPTQALYEIIGLLEEIQETDTQREDFVLATPVYMTLGEKSYGVSAGYAEVHYTLRTWNNPTMDRVGKTVVHRIKSIAEKHQIDHEIRWTESFASNNNHPEAVSMITKAAKENKLLVTHKDEPFKWGEDFGLFTEKFKGAMFGLGAGLDCPALHNPDYDYPDDISPSGIKMFESLIDQVLDA